MRSVWRIFGTWLAQLKTDIAAPKGWELLAKSLVFLVGLLGLLLTFLALVLNLQMEEIKRNEESYQRFLTELGSSQERVRVAAIARMPELLARRGQPNPSLNPLSVLWRSFGFGQVQVHAQAVRGQVKQLLLSGPIEGSPLTQAESQALVDALVRIPPASWFERSNLAQASTGGLRWLWDSPNAQIDPRLAAFTRNLLAGAKLKGITITGLDLSRAELSGLVCIGCRFDRVSFSEANLLNARLENSFFDYTNLDGAKLVGSQLTNVSFYGASLRGISLRKSHITNSQFYQPELGPAPNAAADSSDLRGAYFKSTTFTECQSAAGASFMLAEFSESRFYRCILKNANFSGALLDGTVFDGSSLSQADLSNVSARQASFVNVDLAGTNLSRANLLGADLTGTKGLSGADHEIAKERRFINFNIGVAKGLDRTTRSLLIQAGAVELACDLAWDRYKQAGYPYEVWLSYRVCENR